MCLSSWHLVVTSGWRDWITFHVCYRYISLTALDLATNLLFQLHNSTNYIVFLMIVCVWLCCLTVSVVAAGCYGHPRVELEPAGVLPVCLLQDRLQPAGLQSLDEFPSSSHSVRYYADVTRSHPQDFNLFPPCFSVFIPALSVAPGTFLGPVLIY